MEKVNLESKLLTFTDVFSPKIVARMNDYKIAVVKVKGEFVWHKHEETDDLLLVLKGRLRIQLRGRNDIILEPGELFVVPKGVSIAHERTRKLTSS